ncbi:MAG TPA: hypothetical protein VJ692_06690 [Nitrospiraceae bacterium]|nr:hypothetical protein [Nitrospiraceae bacterium]
MRRWLSDALLISLPCVLALLLYDWAAMVVLRHGPPRLVPWHELAEGLMQDIGLATTYAVTITPRVTEVVAGEGDRIRHACLIMLGLGLAWYAVVCAWLTRLLDAPLDLGMSLVVLFVIPMIVSPSYVRWLRTKVPKISRRSGDTILPKYDAHGHHPPSAPK